MLRSLLIFVVISLFGCGIATASESGDVYVSPAHSFSLTLPQGAHIMSHTSGNGMEFLDIGYGNMPGYEIDAGGIQSVSWSNRNKNVSYNTRESQIRFQEFLQKDLRLKDMRIAKSASLDIHGNYAYQIEGTAIKDAITIRFIATRIEMQNHVATVFSTYSISNDNAFSDKESLASQFKTLKIKHRELCYSIRADSSHYSKIG